MQVYLEQIRDLLSKDPASSRLEVKQGQGVRIA